MPIGVYERTEYHKKINSESHKGIKMPIRTKSHRKNLSISLKGKHTSPNTEFKKGHPNLVSKESRKIAGKKISKARKGMKFTAEHRNNIANRSYEWQKGKKHWNWKGGKIETSEGYIKVLVKNHPRADKGGYVLEHVLVMENKLKRHIERSERVHHRNGTKNDNREENLKLFNNEKSHQLYHYKHKEKYKIKHFK